jgi:4-alpha-glucanotransferase
MKLERSSGILLHISSLPSPFGIGDLGKSAYEFVDFLHLSGYHYWQILPINPTEKAFSHSPYSSHSAFAGNPLLISPEMLVKDGLLGKENISSPPSFPKQKVDFGEVSNYKSRLLDLAYNNFIKKEEKYSQPFSLFCEENKGWLDDYSLYLSLKEKYQGGWDTWPKEIRDRKQDELERLKEELAQPIKKEKVIQYWFFSQWEKLADYSHQKEISFIGDIPFYINHDSADCWSHASYFKLNKAKKPTKVSGVPPDYYSETGQLWGTPVFDWKALQKNGFDWWISRLEQNLKLYDVVRLDHFRAFAAFWEVPAQEETAINGKWTHCPGKEFFTKVKKRFPDMPFIAEDLGMMDEPVYELLRKFSFPGMKVLQFAFDENLGENAYILHNHLPHSIVFSGTHDNNTSLGWFKSLGKGEAERLSNYVGIKVNKTNAHLVLHRLALMSVSALAIVPMQDILGLDEKAIMNRPGTNRGNWTWKMSPDQIPMERVTELKKLNQMYGRWKEKTIPEKGSGVESPS